MLTISTWFWSLPNVEDKYGIEDVLKLQASVKRHMVQPHRFVVVTNAPGEFEDLPPGNDMIVENIDREDYPLLAIKGCLARLRMFDSGFQKRMGVTDRLVCMDLDIVITGTLDPLFDMRPEPFVILQGANAANPCPFNGSLMMLKAHEHQEVWTDFALELEEARKRDPKALPEMPFYEFPDDQGWLWKKIPNAAGWKAGAESGVYAFQKPGWPKGTDLPADARMVVFPGWRSPEKFKQLPWVQQHWRP